MVLKKGPVATAEAELIAEAAWPEDGIPIPRILMDAGMEVTSNGETVSENDLKISAGAIKPALNKNWAFHVKSRKYNFLKQQPRSIKRSYVP